MFKAEPSGLQKNLEKLFLLITVLIIIFATGLRFVALEKSPRGFYLDEAAIAAQVICVRQSGHDNYNDTWPLFSPVLGGGFATPASLYFGSVWTQLFGDSIGSLRGFAALHGALTVVGVFFLALALWGKRQSAFLSALCCAISPWGFQFSRIAWDPPLAPCYLICGLAIILYEGSERSIKQYWQAAIGGLLLSLACYSYPPIRMQAALFFPLFALFFLFVNKPKRKIYGVGILTFLISLIPLFVLIASGKIQGRYQSLSILNDSYLNQFGERSIWLVIKIFLDNMALNLSPKYLFLSGDSNLRHATQSFGQWSWLEILSLVFLVVLILRRKFFQNKRELGIFVLLVWAYLSAVAPAAMTWESNPHALRSIGAFPFLALLSGYILNLAVENWSMARGLIVALSLGFASLYFCDFFFKYPNRSSRWFDSETIHAIEREMDREEFESEHRTINKLVVAARSIDPDYPPLALRYFELREKFIQCR